MNNPTLSSTFRDYAPFDLNEFKPLEFKSDRALAQQFECLIADLSAKDAEWQTRVYAMQQLQSILVGRHRFADSLQQSLFRLQPLIMQQMLDLRSAVVVQAVRTISLMAQILREEFQVLGQRFMHPNGLFKVIQSGNKLIAEAGHFCILSILHNVHSHRILLRILSEARNKNKNVRAKTAQYVGLALRVFPEHVVSTLSRQLPSYFKQAITDADKATRQFTREAFYEWNIKHPDLATRLMESFDPPTIRVIHSQVKNKPYCQNLLSVEVPRSPSRQFFSKTSSLADLAVMETQYSNVQPLLSSFNQNSLATRRNSSSSMAQYEPT